MDLPLETPSDLATKKGELMQRDVKVLLLSLLSILGLVTIFKSSLIEKSNIVTSSVVKHQNTSSYVLTGLSTGSLVAETQNITSSGKNIAITNFRIGGP